MIVREPDNLCVICGAVLPEGRQVCPICGTKDDVESYAKLIRTDIQDEPLAKAALETALKIKDECEQAFRQGYLTGFNEGYKQGRKDAQDEINRLREYIARQSEEEYD